MVSRAIEPSNTTYQDFYLKASVFSGENRTLAQFDTAVINRGLNKRSADKLGPMANRIAGVENPRQIVRWAYSEKVKVGDVSPVFEDGKNYIVVALKDANEKGFSPVEKVKEQIRPLVLNRKKSDYLVEKIKSNSTSDIYRLAQILNEKVDTATNLAFTARNIPGFGREYEVIGEVFAMETGKVSAPIKGSNAVFVVMVDKINTPAESSNFTSNIAQLKSAFSSKVTSNSVFKALEKKSEIVDNRLLFY
jgi:peptidyl-prolyl cis-trans isomerase D